MSEPSFDVRERNIRIDQKLADIERELFQRADTQKICPAPWQLFLAAAGFAAWGGLFFALGRGWLLH